MAFSVTTTVQHQKIGRGLYMVSEGVMVSYLKAESRTHYISKRGVELIKLIKLVSFQLESVTRPFPSYGSHVWKIKTNSQNNGSKC